MTLVSGSSGCLNEKRSPISGFGGVQSPLMALLATNLFIIPANLTASSEIHTGYFSYVNVTDTTQYSGHDTAHYSGYSYSGIPVPADAYWDRQKGILLEYKVIIGPDPNAQYKSSITVESTNMWSMPIDWLPLVAIIIAAVVVIGAAVFIMRRRKHATIPPAQQAPQPPVQNSVFNVSLAC